MSYQKIRCAYCQAEFEDLVIATHHSRACDDSPNAKLIRAVKTLKAHPCLQAPIDHSIDHDCLSRLIEAIEALP